MVAAVVYVVVFVVKAAAIVRAGMLNADTASGPVIADLIGEAPAGREVVLGNFAWATSLWAQEAVGWLPGHRTLWEIGPYVVALATFGLVVDATRRVFDGRLALAVTGVVLLCAAPWTGSNLGSWTLHGPAAFAIALGGWAAVWLTADGARRREAAESRGAVRAPARAVVVGAVVGVVLGASATSDPLVWIGAVVPLVATLALAGVGPVRARAVALAPIVAGILAGALVSALAMDATDLTARDYPLSLAAPGDWPDNINILGKALAGLGNGDVFGLPFGAAKLLHLLGLGLTALAVVAVAVAVVRLVAATPHAIAPLRAHVAFWTIASLLLVASFVGSSAPEGIYSNKYLVGVLLGVAAVLPLVAERGRVAARAVLVGVALFALVGVGSLVRGEMTENPARFPGPALAKQLAAFAQARGLSVGYASYWDAMPLTWHAGEDAALRVYPVVECAPEHALCPLSFHRISSWYRPRGAVRTFLVMDPELRLEPLTGVDARLGRPESVDRVGRLTVYTFPYDIAARMGGVRAGFGAVAQ